MILQVLKDVCLKRLRTSLFTILDLRFFMVRGLRLRGMLCNISHLDLQLTNQLDPVEGSTYKTGVKGLGE